MAYPRSAEESFRSDLLLLLERLNEDLLIELGNPVPRDSCLPKRAAIHCPTCATELVSGSTEGSEATRSALSDGD
jgi:hypothetical protein